MNVFGIIVVLFIAFGIVGSIEARMRNLLGHFERQFDALNVELARIESKLDRLLQQQAGPNDRGSLDEGEAPSSPSKESRDDFQ